MLTFVLRKMLSNKWMIVCLLIGNIFLCSVVASVPTYSDAILNRVLTKQLEAVQTQENIYPGLASLKQEVRTQETNGLVAEAKGLSDQLMEELGADILGAQTRRNSMSYYLTCLSNRNPRTSYQKVNLYTYSDIEDHITLVSGRMASDSMTDGVIEVIINERTMNEEDMLIDDLYAINDLKMADGTPYQLKVVGIYRNGDEDSELYWEEPPENISESAIVADAVFEQLFVNNFSRDYRYSITWTYYLDYTQLDAVRLSEYEETIAQYQELLKNGYSVTDSKFNFQSTIAGFSTYSSKLDITLWVLLVPIFVLLAFFIYMVSQKILEEDKNTIAVIKSRGASRAQVIGIFTIQSVLIALCSVAISLPLGMGICKIIGSSNGFLDLVQRTALKVRLRPEAIGYTLIAAGISVLTMVIPAFSYSKVTILDHKRASTAEGGKKTAALFGAAAALLAVSLYGYYSFNNQIGYIMASEGGAVLDPLLFLSSSLFVISLGVLTAVLIPVVLRLIYLAGRKFWSPSLYLTFLRVIRAVDGQRSIMIFMVLTIAIGIFNAKMARTINQNNEDNIRYTNGASIVLQEKWSNNAGDTNAEQVVYIEPDYGKYENLMQEHSDVTATKVLNSDDYSVGTLANVRLMGIETEGFAHTAWMRDGLLPIHWYNYLNSLSLNAGAVLVSENFLDLGYQLGDEITVTDVNKENFTGVIYGFVDYWPTYFSTETTLDSFDRTVVTDHYLVVGNLSQIQSTLGMQPYEVWIDAPEPSVIYDFAEEYSIRYKEFTDTAADIVEMKNDPVLQGTNGVLTVGFIIVLLVCMTGFMIYWILSIKSRSLQFGVLRAMGMPMRQIISMLVSEQLFITFTSIGAGIFVGWLASELFVPIIQMSFRSTELSLPLRIVADSGDFIRLFAVVAVVIVACMAALIALIRKIKVAQALKLGED